MNKDLSNTSEEELQNFHKTISKNVKKFREQNTMTQLDTALDIGIKSVAFYSNCENNKNNKHFNVEHLYKLSKTFKIDIAEFFK